MTENFCYNQIGINHILKQFGDAISNKQYKNPIPYNTYRKIRTGFQNIFISFDCGDILVKAAAILESTYGEMLKSIKNLEFIHDDQNVITLPRDIIRTYIDREKFINEIPCDSEGRELATLNQNASKANDNW